MGNSIKICRQVQVHEVKRKVKCQRMETKDLGAGNRKAKGSVRPADKLEPDEPCSLLYEVLICTRNGSNRVYSMNGSTRVKIVMRREELCEVIQRLNRQEERISSLEEIMEDTSRWQIEGGWKPSLESIAEGHEPDAIDADCS